MAVSMIVAYEQGSNFKVEPYMAKHVPTLMEELKDHGLENFKLQLFPPGSPYEAFAVLQFDTKENMERLGSLPADVLDTTYFSDKQPKLWGTQLFANLP